jgi:hypothetical protein
MPLRRGQRRAIKDPDVARLKKATNFGLRPGDEKGGKPYRRHRGVFASAWTRDLNSTCPRWLSSEGKEGTKGVAGERGDAGSPLFRFVTQAPTRVCSLEWNGGFRGRPLRSIGRALASGPSFQGPEPPPSSPPVKRAATRRILHPHAPRASAARRWNLAFSISAIALSHRSRVHSGRSRRTG